MKIKLYILSSFCFILVGIAVLSCTTQQTPEKEDNNTLEGVWKLVSGEWSMQDSVITFPGSDLKGVKSYKCLGKTTFAIVGQDTASDMHWAHAGKYRTAGDTYVEYFEITKNINRIGDSAVYKYTLDGDKWIISSDRLKEEWKRIE